MAAGGKITFKEGAAPGTPDADYVHFYVDESDSIPKFKTSDGVVHVIEAAHTKVQEVPTGSINGSNTAFSLAHTPATDARLSLYLNGFFQRQGTDYTVSAANITMIIAPATGQTLDAVYEY